MNGHSFAAKMFVDAVAGSLIEVKRLDSSDSAAVSLARMRKESGPAVSSSPYSSNPFVGHTPTKTPAKTVKRGDPASDLSAYGPKWG